MLFLPLPHGTRPRRLSVAMTALVGSAVTAWLTGIPAFAQAPAPGDILLNTFTDQNVLLYNPAGGLRNTYTDGATMAWEGAGLTPDGNIVTTFRLPDAGVKIFTPAGVQIGAFATPETLIAGDISVFADGVLAIADQQNQRVLLYSQSGTLLNTLSAPGAIDPFGNYVDPATDTLWQADVNGNQIDHFTESGTLLGSFATTFRPSDLVVDPTDGTLWVSDRTNELVQHLSPLGVVLSNFDSGLVGTTGIGISANGATLYVAGHASGVVHEFTRTGVSVGSFAIVGGDAATPLFLTVVPSAAAPEPGTLALLGLAALPLAGLVLRRRDQGGGSFGKSA